jgi:hypothetical protein
LPSTACYGDSFTFFTDSSFITFLWLAQHSVWCASCLRKIQLDALCSPSQRLLMKLELKWFVLFVFTLVLYRNICCSSTYFTVSIHSCKWDHKIDFWLIYKKNRHWHNRSVLVTHLHLQWYPYTIISNKNCVVTRSMISASSVLNKYCSVTTACYSYCHSRNAMYIVSFCAYYGRWDKLACSWPLLWDNTTVIHNFWEWSCRPYSL